MMPVAELLTQRTEKKKKKQQIDRAETRAKPV